MDEVAAQAPPEGGRARTGGGRLRTLLVLAVTAALVVTAVYLIDRPKAQAAISTVHLTGQGGNAPVIGRPAQDFTATTVTGQKISLSQYRGHPVWLTFGATWCAACRAEIPDIEATYERAKAGGVVVIGVFISEDVPAVRDYAQRAGLTFPMVADPNTAIASAYRVLGIPVHFFIDRDGVLRSSNTGSLTPARMDAALREISR